MALKERVQNIILKPNQEWDVIAGESTSTPDLIKNYALPLVAIGVIAGFIGTTLIGSFRFTTGLAVAIASGVMALVGVYVLGLIINALAPKFGAEKNSAQALKLAVYSTTPAWVAGVLNILPALGVLAAGQTFLQLQHLLLEELILVGLLLLGPGRQAGRVRSVVRPGRRAHSQQEYGANCGD